MPIYEFKCKDCGKESEILLRSAEWSGTPCPKCGSRKLMKKLSVFAAKSEAAESSGPAPSCGSGMGPCDGCHCGMGDN